MNPMHFGFEMLAKAQNRSLHKITTSADRVHGFATSSPMTGAIQLFLINKFSVTQEVNVTLPRYAFTAPSAFTSMVDGADHWGTITDPTTFVCEGRVCKLALPALSFSMVE